MSAVDHLSDDYCTGGREVQENTDRMQGTSVIEATSTGEWISRPQQRYHLNDLLDETCDHLVPLCAGFDI